nr:hypothetical protein [uncultured Flavobacterium sp.]
MRELTNIGVPFSITFLTYNMKTGESNGFKTVHNVQLRKGLKKNQSTKANQLIGYNAEGDNRWFNASLLFNLNEIKIKEKL